MLFGGAYEIASMQPRGELGALPKKALTWYWSRLIHQVAPKSMTDAVRYEPSQVRPARAFSGRVVRIALHPGV